MAEQERVLVVDAALAVGQIGVAHAAGKDVDHHLARTGVGDDDIHHLDRLALLPRDHSAHCLTHESNLSGTHRRADSGTLGRRDARDCWYLSHGAPPLVDDELWVSQLAAWAADLPAPKAILVVSAHWEAAPLTIGSTTVETPLTYDFWGFPEHYYDVTYDAPGAPALAATVEALMPDGEPVAHDRDRRLDHGAYVPLTVMYPAADIPVLQISLPTLDPQRLLHLGERLRPLRDDGVLVIGSGFTTHGLPFLDDPSPGATPPGWSVEFDEWAAERFSAGDVDGAHRLPDQGAGDAVRPPHDRTLRAAVRGARRVRRSGAGARTGRRRLLDGPGETVDSAGVMEVPWTP